MVAPGGHDRSRDARRDPGDVGAVEGAGRSSGSRPGAPEPGPGKERATITLGVVNFRAPFGKPGWVREAGRVEERVDPSTPSSTTPILIPWPKPPVGGPELCPPITAGLLFVSRW